MLKERIVSYFHQLKSIFFNSYSATGEDVIVYSLFKSLAKDKINYLDLGTSSPIFGSNTYLFYKMGNKGVCVEANPLSLEKIKYVRKRDVCLNVAISDKNAASVDFHIFDDAGISTLLLDEAKYRESFGSFRVQKTIQIPSIEINTLISSYFEKYPDFISIDVEGMDLKILQSLDYDSFPIPVICVETVFYAENYKRSKISEIPIFLNSKGYFLYADTFINSIFVKKDWYDNIPLHNLPKW